MSRNRGLIAPEQVCDLSPETYSEQQVRIIIERRRYNLKRFAIEYCYRDKVMS